MLFDGKSISSIHIGNTIYLVASSNSKICGFFKIARAIATLCFWPPESIIPRSPTTVSYLSGKLMMKSCALASLAACSISAWLTAYTQCSKIRKTVHFCGGGGVQFWK